MNKLIKVSALAFACGGLALSASAAPKPYHAKYDVQGSLVKKNSTHEVIFKDAWTRVEINNIGTGMGPFAQWNRERITYVVVDGQPKLYNVKLKKNGKFNKKGTVTDNVMAEHFQGKSDAELEAFGEQMYTQLGYTRAGHDSANDCEKWTNPQLGDVCLRDKYMMVYLNSLGMSYTLREVSYDVDDSEFEPIATVQYTEAPNVNEVLSSLNSGQPPQGNNSYPDEDYDADAQDGNDGRPKNMQEAMGMFKSFFGGDKNKQQEAPKTKPADVQPAAVSSSIEAAAEAAADDASSP